MPNLQLAITDKDGNSTEYLPSMSLENGYLSKGQQIWDFSPYDLLGGHFEKNNGEEDMPTFIGSWWGEYELNGIFDWGCTDTNEMFLEHISGGVLLYGTEGEKFHFEKMVEEE